MDAYKVDILIDEEFKEMIPDLSGEERSQLEKNILSDGCRDPLSVWLQDTCYCEECGCVRGYRIETGEVDGRSCDWYHCEECGEFIEEGPHALLVDGHNRKAICEAHGLEYEIVLLEFDSREEAKDWIDENQLGRRNLTPDAFRLILGRCYNRKKKSPAGRSDREFSGGQIEHPKTSEKLAEDHGVSEATVRRAGKFAEEVENTPELKEAIKKYA